jgi:ubiquinone/menaquinone biosynthesis C-methylase UbiE
MNPYFYVEQATHNGESLLSLCCGIGLELSGLTTQDITAVDIAPQYLAEVKHRCPQAKTVESDALEYIKDQPDDSVDVISIIDGIEHMEKFQGVEIIKHMKRVCKKEILLFTPQGPGEDGYLKNEPHNAWGIEGADHFQTHKSGWTADELELLGFTPVLVAEDISQHGEPYKALMYKWSKDVQPDNAD